MSVNGSFFESMLANYKASNKTPVKSPALTMSVSAILNSIANTNPKSQSPAKKSEVVFKRPPKDFVLGEIVSEAPYSTTAEDLAKKPVGIGAKWKTFNKFSLCPFRNVNVASKDEPSRLAPCKVKIHFLSPEINLFYPSLRKLVNESSGVFLSIQKIQELTQSDSRPEMLRFSKRYRSIIKACAEELQDLQDKATEEDTITFRNFFTIFYNIECIWQLAELLYIQTTPDEVIVFHLLDWVSYHFPSREIFAMKILTHNSPCADQENFEYWDAVFGCALHGKIEIVRALLALHSKADHSAFYTADEQLKNMPIYNVYSGRSAKEFQILWKQWQMTLSFHVENKIFAIEPNLEKLMKLVLGENLFDFKEYVDEWFELLGATLLFTAPCCKQSELSRHANSLATKWQAKRLLDNIILELIDNNLPLVIRDIQLLTDNGWFSAHMTDLLYHCGRLNIVDKDQVNVAAQLRDSLILDYGTLLSEHHSLWQCGAGYLENCGIQGKERLFIILQRLTLDSEARIQKIFDVALNNDMQTVVTSICKIQMVKSIKQGRSGNALSWALKAQDPVFMTYLADEFLKYYIEHGEIKCRDLLESLGSSIMINERLTFLGKYCEFHQIYNMGEFKDSASLLISLIVSNLSPKFFWPAILTDAIPLLECEEMVFSSMDTFKLLRALELHGEELSQKKKAIFRLAAARNLARTLISQESSGDKQMQENFVNIGQEA